MIKNAPLQVRSTGYVKWFNKKAGYGFIKLLDSSNSNRVDGVYTSVSQIEQEAHEEKNDIFVHFTNIRPKAVNFGEVEEDFGEENTVGGEQQAFRFLVKGEYIEFDLKTSRNPKYNFFASDVTGIFDGHIMCDMMSIRPSPYPSDESSYPSCSSSTTTPALVLSKRSTGDVEPLFNRVVSKKNRRGPPPVTSTTNM